MSVTAARAGTSRPGTRQVRPPAATAAGTAAAAPARPGGSLRVVAAPQPTIARGPFVVLVLVLLATGLLGLLLLNTVLAQGSFHLHSLQVSGKKLADQEQGLQHEVDALQAPGAIAAQAQAQGMVPAGPPVFLRLPDGVILGDPVPAPAPAPGTVAPTAGGVPQAATPPPAATRTTPTTPTATKAPTTTTTPPTGKTTTTTKPAASSPPAVTR